MYIFIPVTIAILLIGCDSVVDENNTFDYSIEQMMNCFCPQAGTWVKLYVEADTIAAAVRLSDNKNLSYEEWRSYKTIKDLFEIVSRLDTVNDNVTIRMDSENTYPSYIYFNLNSVDNSDSLEIIINDA